jgi:hypothetical protein
MKQNLSPRLKWTFPSNQKQVQFSPALGLLSVKYSCFAGVSLVGNLAHQRHLPAAVEYVPGAQSVQVASDTCVDPADTRRASLRHTETNHKETLNAHLSGHAFLQGIWSRSS